MDISPQLEFNRQCQAAFERYADLFDGEITTLNKLGETKDAPLPPGSTDGDPEMVRFAELRIGKVKIRGNDLPPGQYRTPRGFNLSMHFDKADDARRIFEGLAEGGTVTVEPAKVAWAEFFGMVTDRFAIPWIILGFKK